MMLRALNFLFSIFVSMFLIFADNIYHPNDGGCFPFLSLSLPITWYNILEYFSQFVRIVCFFFFIYEYEKEYDLIKYESRANEMERHKQITHTFPFVTYIRMYTPPNLFLCKCLCSNVFILKILSPKEQKRKENIFYVCCFSGFIFSV